MSVLHGTLTIARLTWLEARRRRIVLAAVIGGLLYVTVFGIAAHFSVQQVLQGQSFETLRYRAELQIMTLAGLYVANFLAIAVAILLPVDTFSGEIATGVMQTLASKPVRRFEILLGKWLAYCGMSCGYLLLVTGGVAGVTWWESGYINPSLLTAAPYLLLGVIVMTSFTITGGIRLTTVTNGMAAFAVYAIAFIGGWVEQIGFALGSDGARRVGTAISLFSPADTMWRKAAYELTPAFMRELSSATPFGAGSAPSTAMVIWTCGVIAGVVGLGVLLFRRRPL